MRWRFIGAIAVLAAPLVAMPAMAAEPLSGKRTVLNDVHTDAIDVQYIGGELRLRTRIGNQPYTYAEASEVIFQLKDIAEAAVQVPDDPMFAFLGNEGDSIWLAPQTQAESLLFAGWDTESIPNGVLAGDTVDLTLTGVQGPGRVEIFQDGSFGEPVRIFSSTDPGYKTLHQPVASHAHANWVFSALGRYELTFRASAAGLQSAPVTYTWFVGGTSAADIVALPTTTELAVAGAELTAKVEPTRAAGWIEFRDGAIVLGAAEVRDGTASLTPGLGVGQHQLTAHFIPRYDNDFKPSTSPVVPVVITNPQPTGSPTPSASTPPPAAPPPPPAPATSTNSAAVCVQSSRRILDHEHVDYAVRVVNGRLESSVKEGPTWYHPSDVVLHVKPQAAATVPASGFDFLGSPGSKVWQIPQTQQSGIIWLGWNTESVAAGVNWSLTKVSGPGRVAVYEHSSFGQPSVIFNSGDGLPDQFSVNAGTHAHGNWAFGKEGVYRLTFVHRMGQLSDTETITIVVGSTDPKPVAKRTNCGLPRTGDWVGGSVAVGGALVLAGAAMVIGARRRRAS